MTTIMHVAENVAQQQQQELTQLFGVEFYCWEHDCGWQCLEAAVHTPDDLTEWFDEILERSAQQNKHTRTIAPYEKTQMNGELWIATVVDQDEFPKVIVAGKIPSQPQQLAQFCVQLLSHKAVQATALAEQRHTLESYAVHMGTNYEELCFLRQLSQHMVFCNANRSLQDVAVTILPSLHELVASQVMLFIPALEIHTPDHSIANEQHYVQGDFSGDRHQLTAFSDWVRKEHRDSIFIWNRSSGLNAHVANASWQHIHSMLVVPIAKESQIYGWFVAVNKGASSAALSDYPMLLGTDEFGSVEASLLSSAAIMLSSHALNVNLFNAQERLIVDIIHTLVSVLEAKDQYTCGHSNRVALIARRLAETLGLPEEDCEDIYLSGLLHDIGKVGVSDDVLLKPGQLTAEEFAQVKQHPERGYHILKGLAPLADLLPGVLHHHEAVDGTGYPHGLQGEAIPLMARILAVADTYDALTSNRPYRQGMSLEKSESILRAGRGKQWDANVIDAYFTIREEVLAIGNQWKIMAQTESLGIPYAEALRTSVVEPNRVNKAVESRRTRS
jgi:HD-GYP domain-containing protein (c-di-GMP phosphodiesterase class II)